MLLTVLRLCKQCISRVHDDRERLAAYHADLEAGRMSSHGNHENNHHVVSNNLTPSAISGTGRLVVASADSSAINETGQSSDSEGEGDGNLVHDSPCSSQEDGDVDMEEAASNHSNNVVFAMLKKAFTWIITKVIIIIIIFFRNENDDRKKEAIILKNENDARERETQILNDKIQRLQHVVFLLVARQEDAGFTPIRQQLDSIVPRNMETPAPFVELLRISSFVKAPRIPIFIKAATNCCIRYFVVCQDRTGENVLQSSLPNDIVIKNILPFLELPSYTFEGEVLLEDEDEDEPSATHEHARECLLLNCKRAPAICKILHGHPDIDITPLFEFNLMCLPLVVEWFEKACSHLEEVNESSEAFRSRQLSAVYKFVRGMPQLTIDGYGRGNNHIAPMVGQANMVAPNNLVRKVYLFFGLIAIIGAASLVGGGTGGSIIPTNSDYLTRTILKIKQLEEQREREISQLEDIVKQRERKITQLEVEREREISQLKVIVEQREREITQLGDEREREISKLHEDIKAFTA